MCPYHSLRRLAHAALLASLFRFFASGLFIRFVCCGLQAYCDPGLCVSAMEPNRRSSLFPRLGSFWRVCFQ